MSTEAEAFQALTDEMAALREELRTLAASSFCLSSLYRDGREAGKAGRPARRPARRLHAVTDGGTA